MYITKRKLWKKVNNQNFNTLCLNYKNKRTETTQNHIYNKCLLKIKIQTETLQAFLLLQNKNKNKNNKIM